MSSRVCVTTSRWIRPFEQVDFGLVHRLAGPSTAPHDISLSIYFCLPPQRATSYSLGRLVL